MSRPRISKLQTWKRHEEKIKNYLVIALLNMRKSKLNDVNEKTINRKLCIGLREVIAKADITPYIILLDAPNQPKDDELENLEVERKIPDIQFFWNDSNELDLKRCQKSFTIECKRLGRPLRNGTILTEEYVKNGILRFVKKDYGYAKDTQSGIMVGYLQNMNSEDILTEVNSYNFISSLLPLEKLSEFEEGGVTILKQILIRSEVNPNQFKLSHLWADFR